MSVFDFARMVRLLVLYGMLVFGVLSCVPQAAKIDPTAFLVDTGETEKIPAACKSSYDTIIPKVAVVNFTNNTTFDYANMVQASVQGTAKKTTVGGAVAAGGPGIAGVVWGQKERTQFQADSQKIERQINAKLSESVEDGVTNEMVLIGGSKIFTRSEIQKVLNEQKFQMSGLADESTLVNFGKVAGVKYIITGSVNNVNLTWLDLKEAKEGASKHLGALGSVLSIGMATQEGWNIKTDIALRIIDVESGEILFSKIVSGREIIGKTPYPNYDALIGGIKKAAAKAITDTRPELSKWFSVKGYILQTRTAGDKSSRAALVNVGRKQGVKEDTELQVYTFQEIKDPFSGKASCDMVRLPVLLKPTDQLQDDKGWFIIDGDQGAAGRVKAGQLVERGQMKGQGFMQKIGY